MNTIRFFVNFRDYKKNRKKSNLESVINNEFSKFKKDFNPDNIKNEKVFCDYKINFEKDNLNKEYSLLSLILPIIIVIITFFIGNGGRIINFDYEQKILKQMESYSNDVEQKINSVNRLNSFLENKNDVSNYLIELKDNINEQNWIEADNNKAQIIDIHRNALIMHSDNNDSNINQKREDIIKIIDEIKRYNFVSYKSNLEQDYFKQAIQDQISFMFYFCLITIFTILIYAVAKNSKLSNEKKLRNINITLLEMQYNYILKKEKEQNGRRKRLIKRTK